MKKSKNYFFLLSLGAILSLLVLLFFFRHKNIQTSHSGSATISSPSTEVLQNVVTVFSYEENEGYYRNDILKLSFNFSEDVLIEEHQEVINPKLDSTLNKEKYSEMIKLRTYLIVKEKTSNRDIAKIRMESTPNLKTYTNFSEAAADTFKYWRSSTSVFDDSEKNRFSEQKMFSVLNNGNKISAYKYTIYRPNENLTWIYIPQKNTTSSEELSKNMVNFISIKYNENDEDKMSKILTYLALH